MFKCKLDTAILPHYDKLPSKARKQTRAALKKWEQNNDHNSLGFKALFRNQQGMLYSMKVNGNQPPGYRLLGYLEEGNIINWFWVGPHDEYERILARLR